MGWGDWEYFGGRGVFGNIDSLSLLRARAGVQRRRGAKRAHGLGKARPKRSSKARPRGPSAARWLASMERVRQCKQIADKLR